MVGPAAKLRQLPGGPPRPKYWTRRLTPDSSDARELRKLHILQRQFAHPLAAGREDGVGDGRRNGRRAAFADAAPFLAARRHEIDLDLGCFGLTHHTICVEVQLLHLTGLDRHLAIEHRRETEDPARLHLGLDDLGVDHVIAVDRHHKAIHADRVAVVHRDFGAGADTRAVVFRHRDAASLSFGKLLLPIALFVELFEYADEIDAVDHGTAEFVRILARRMGQLVDKAFIEEAILRTADRTPEV